MRRIPKPNPGEYPPYADMYMRLLPEDGRILDHLWDNFVAAGKFLRAIPEERRTYRYAAGKWSIREILVHLIDDERIYAYRALRWARGEQQGLIGFDQEAYAALSEADGRSLDSILQEYEAVRLATIALFANLPEASLTRMGHGTGSANDASVRALAYHIAGHEQHHLNIIRERYL